MYEVKNGPDNLFNIMMKAYERSSFMGCSIEPDPYKTEAETSEGLIRGHAYSITSLKYVDIETPRVRGKIPLMRIRNPWGKRAEWKGAWSDGSKEWEFISEDVKEDLGLTFDADGEFWMSFKDFRKYWDRLEICNLSAHGLDDDEDEGKRWASTTTSRAPGYAGPPPAGAGTFWRHSPLIPQYIITLDSPDEDDENQKCTVLIALMQKNRRAQRKFGIDCLTIGFAIYALPDPDSQPKPLPVRFFKYNASVARSPTFINLREVCSRFSLNPGTYVIVPSTFEPNEEGEFIIRVFTESRVEMKENDGDVGMGEVDDRVKETVDEEDEQKARVSEFFKTVAGDDNEIDWSELKEVLDMAMKRDSNTKYLAEFDFAGFTRDTCRSMVALMDVDMSGKLGLDEFIQLWKSVRTWKLRLPELVRAEAGAHFRWLQRQQQHTPGAGAQVRRHSGQIYFDDFIMCAVKLKAMIEIFRERQSADENPDEKTATFTLEEWVNKTLYS
ncbi:Calpain-B [Orchesella cincta]|uniref:Calpain-B n=1 Tax=Orchesella cincta TaxID=48709 RepID=A0A1D2MW36_ORCCI|nr:Calpain-B [Orchesella cincta]